MARKYTIEELQKIFAGRLLVPRLYGVLQEAHDQQLAPFGLTTRQATILASCDIGEAHSMADLARIYSIDASSITRLVERLVRKGFLARRRSKSDRRHVFITITPEGKKVLWQAIPVAAKLSLHIWSGVTEQEKAALESIVNKVVANLNQGSGPVQHFNKAKGEQSVV